MSIESTIGDWILRSVSFSASRALRAQKKIYRGEVTIPYWRIDRGRGQWLVNLPGFADEKESFFPTALQLRNDFNFLLPETLGFGESPRDASLPYRVENYARWIIAFLRECAPEKVWLVGNSLGGAIASRVALEAPELLHGCIPVGSAGYLHSSRNPLLDEVRRGENPFVVTDEASYRRFIARLFARERKRIPFISASIHQRMVRDQPWLIHMLDELKGAWLDESTGDPMERAMNRVIGDAQVPVHFIWGDQDSFFDGETPKEICALHPHLQYSLMEGVGHCPHMEAPRWFARVIREATGVAQDSMA